MLQLVLSGIEGFTLSLTEGFILRIEGPRHKPPPKTILPPIPFSALSHPPVISTGMNDSSRFSLRGCPSVRSSTVILGRQKFGPPARVSNRTRGARLLCQTRARGSSSASSCGVEKFLNIQDKSLLRNIIIV